MSKSFEFYLNNIKQKFNNIDELSIEDYYEKNKCGILDDYLNIDCYNCKFLYPYKKEEKIEETPIDYVKESNDTPIDYVKESNDIYRIVLNHQFDMVVDEGEYYAIKRKPKYPNTINECYNSLEDDELVNNKLLYAFRDLIVARNAYWKIAGKQMGLSKPWKPDWKDFCESKYCIYITESEIKTGEFHNDNQILAFPTMEMCEEFLKNFGYIIEKCKDFYQQRNVKI
jgi:hypothetical protein